MHIIYISYIVTHRASVDSVARDSGGDGAQPPCDIKERRHYAGPRRAEVRAARGEEEGEPEHQAVARALGQRVRGRRRTHTRDRKSGGRRAYTEKFFL